MLALPADVPESTRLVLHWMTRVFGREGGRPAAFGLILSGLAAASTAFGQARLEPSGEPGLHLIAPSAAPTASAERPAGARQADAPAGAAASVAPVSLSEATGPLKAPRASSAGTPSYPVKLGDDSVFSLRSTLAGKSPELRAREASEQLKRAYTAELTSEVSVARRGDVVLLTVGRTFIVELNEEEAKLAGSTSLEVYAASTASAVRERLVSERKRAAIARSAFAFSLVIFFGLIAVYLLRRLGDFAARGRSWLEARSDRELSLRFQGVEFVRPALLRSTAVLAAGSLKWLAQLGVLYTWFVVVLSLFESTQGYTQRLTGFVVAPLSQLMARLATALPLLVVAVISALAVFVLVRFVGLFFASVARGETSLGWLPNDLAVPTSVLLRAGIALSALVFLAPVVTGDADGALGRVGIIVLVALGLALTPVLASGTIGAIWLYGRRLRVGEYVEFGAYRGRVSELNLLELRLTVSDRTELRVPHLLTLLRPLRLLGARPRLTLDLYVHASSHVTEVRSLLASVAGKVGSDPSVEIVAADADAIRFRVAATCESLEARTAFHIAVLDALSGAGITLGRDRS